MEDDVGTVVREEPLDVGLARELVVGLGRRRHRRAAGALEPADQRPAQEAAAAGDEHAGAGQRHAHFAMNSSRQATT